MHWIFVRVLVWTKAKLLALLERETTVNFRKTRNGVFCIFPQGKAQKTVGESER